MRTVAANLDNGITLPPFLSRFCLGCCLIAMSAAGPVAQAAPKNPAKVFRGDNDVFLGYSRTGSDTFYADTGGLNGWDGALFINIIKPMIGIEGDLSHVGFGASASVPRTTTFLAGPRVMVRGAGFRIFAHGLIGGQHSANSGGPVRISSTSYAYVLGVGLDVPLFPAFAWRLQADRISAPSISPATGTHARFSTGLVFRF